MNIPDEAWDAFQKAYHTYRHTRSPDPGDEGCFDSNARKHALKAALPYIMEGAARDYERRATLAEEEAYQGSDAQRNMQKSVTLKGFARDLRSLAPMEKTPTP